MKKALLLITLCLLSVIGWTQSNDNPQLSIGNGGGITRGTIDTDVLSAIIQEKQEEVKVQVFHNIVVKSFNKADYTKKFRNFTTYHFIYQLMNELTSGKNKQVMMKNITEDFAEFAYVYGFMIYLHDLVETAHRNNKDTFFIDQQFLDESKMVAKSQKAVVKGGSSLQVSSDSAIYRLNLLIDLTYDLLLSDSSYRGEFIFDVDTSDQVFSKWYSADNVYRQELRKADATKKAALEAIRQNIATQLTTFSRIDTSLTDIGGFYKQLKKSKYADFSMSVEQFNSLKFILGQFVNQVKYHSQNNVVSALCTFLLENMTIQYASTGTDSGYIYIDLESAISSLSAEFSNLGEKGLGVYLVPFFSIGANHAYFLNDNKLGPVNTAGNSTDLSNLYFASEKIGFKYKIWNWAYTHKFGSDVNYTYYFRNRTRVRPQTTPTISDLDLIVYGSGLLYNLANLKSEDSFNQGLVGASLGVTFFNKLSVHAGLGVPFTNRQFKNDNLFFTFGFDIPISDYISAIGSGGN